MVCEDAVLESLAVHLQTMAVRAGFCRPGALAGVPCRLGGLWGHLRPVSSLISSQATWLSLPGHAWGPNSGLWRPGVSSRFLRKHVATCLHSAWPAVSRLWAAPYTCVRLSMVVAMMTCGSSLCWNCSSSGLHDYCKASRIHGTARRDFRILG